jgi:hypothetical protein
MYTLVRLQTVAHAQSLATDVFYDLTCQDLPPDVEDNFPEFFGASKYKCEPFMKTSITLRASNLAHNGCNRWSLPPISCVEKCRAIR